MARAPAAWPAVSGSDGAKDVEGGGRTERPARAALLPDAALRIAVLSYEYTMLWNEIVNRTQHGFVLLLIGASKHPIRD